MANIRTKVMDLIKRFKHEKVPCNLCGGTDFKTLKKWDRYGLPMRIAVCNTCKLIQANPRLPQKFYNQFYRRYYRDLHQINLRIGELDDYFEWQYQRAKEIFGPLPEKDELIFEIGCSAGGMLAWFAEHGYPVRGIDLDEKYVNYGRYKGFVLKSSQKLPTLSLDGLCHA